MKIAGIIAAIVLVVVIGVVVFFLRNLDSLVADAIEKYGSEATGTRVSVGSVSIDLREGRGTVSGFEVANPEGFDAPYALSWDEVTVDIDPASVREQPYVVDEVRIVAPEVIFAVNERGQANLRELQQRLQRGGGAAEASSAGEEPRLRIKSFTFEKGRVDVRTAKVGGEDVHAELPSLELSNLGGSNGATASEIGRTVLETYTRQILETVARHEAGRQVEKALDEHLGEGAGEAASGLLDRIRGN